MKVDRSSGLLLVAGGFTGQAYVYDTTTGVDVAALQLGAVINDVVIANGAAWSTDSALPNLYRVPIGPNGTIGTPATLVLSSPATELSGALNRNGIAATPNGKTPIVAHAANSALHL